MGKKTTHYLLLFLIFILSFFLGIHTTPEFICCQKAEQKADSLELMLTEKIHEYDSLKSNTDRKIISLKQRNYADKVKYEERINAILTHSWE